MTQELTKGYYQGYLRNLPQSPRLVLDWVYTYQKKIVEANGGKIWAENNNSDDRRATFYFTLPIDKS